MDFEHLPRFAVADMDAARPLAVLTVPSGCRSAACAGVGSHFRLASRMWPDQIYAVLCDDGDDASNSHCEEAVRSGALEPEAPLVTTWDGWRWAPYAGRRDLDSLREALTLLADGGAATPVGTLRSRPFTCDADAGVPLVTGRLQAGRTRRCPRKSFYRTRRGARPPKARAVLVFLRCTEAPAACCPAVWLTTVPTTRRRRSRSPTGGRRRCARSGGHHGKCALLAVLGRGDARGVLRVYPGAANPFGGDEWEAHFSASTIAFSDEAFRDWLLSGCAKAAHRRCRFGFS